MVQTVHVVLGSAVVALGDVLLGDGERLLPLLLVRALADPDEELPERVEQHDVILLEVLLVKVKQLLDVEVALGVGAVEETRLVLLGLQ